MFHLIVTTDPELVKKARECGAGVFTAEQFPEGASMGAARVTGQKSSKSHALMRMLDIRPNIKGYDYIKYMIEKCEADHSYHKRSFTKEIYPECAEKFSTTKSRVERAVRHAVELSFDKAPEKYTAVFGGKFKKAPKNSEFISLIAEYFVNSK